MTESGAAVDRADAGAVPRPTPCLVAIVGDSGSGKSLVADAVADLLGRDRVTELRLDDYHRYTREERRERGLTALNPSVHNLSLMQEHLKLLREGRAIRNRSYEHADGSFGPIRLIEPREIVLSRGLLGFPTEVLQGMYHLSVFLQPEPELLFRWKLRRDVQSRGYTEAEVLKNIVQHLLDSKEYVVPQAGRAHVVVRHELPVSDAPDDAIRTWVTLRREAACLARRHDLLGGLGEGADQATVGEEVVIELTDRLKQDAVEAWAAASVPAFDPQAVGRYRDDLGREQVRPPLAVVEVLIARLIDLMASPERA